MQLNLNQIEEALNWRAAIKKYDTSKAATDSDLNLILEAGRMAPSSNGLEPWKFIVVRDEQTRLKLREAAYGQPQVTDATFFLVLAAETDKDAVAQAAFERVAKSQNLKSDDPSLDGFKGMVNGAIGGMDQARFVEFAKQQVFIALGFMLEAAALARIDANPMGGFDHEKFDEILNLKDQNLTSAVIMGIGVRDESDGYLQRPKFRNNLDAIVDYI
jgi:nitroreductase/dihydropteridine reductase